MKQINLLILYFSLVATVKSQPYQSGFYVNESIQSFFYLNGDSVILPISFLDAPYVVINKGKFDGNKWLYFTPTPNHLETIVETLSQLPNDTKTILKFNYEMHPFYKSMLIKRNINYKIWNEGDSTTYDIYYKSINGFGYKDVKSYWKNSAFEIEIPESSYNYAELILPSRYGYPMPKSIPIALNMTSTYKIYLAPFVSYDILNKIKYKYNKKENAYLLRFDFKRLKGWYKFTRVDNYQIKRDSAIIQYHINDLVGIRKSK
jgi:hypothetical protein